jgi:hypothetical protein
MNWFERNFEWFKSFFSEEYINGVAGKASSKRVIEIAIVWVFLVAYIKVVLAITVTPGVELLPPDMPWGWAAMLFGILGLKVYENVKLYSNGTTTPTK